MENLQLLAAHHAQISAENGSDFYGEEHILRDLRRFLVEAGEEEQALALLTAARDGSTNPAGRQAAELELGRLGSVDDLKAAALGPDPSLAALARVARAELLAAAGRLAEAEPLWTQVVGDPSGEPMPKSLALLGLARLDVARGRSESARVRLEEVRTLSSDAWVLGRVALIEADLP